MPSRRWQKRLTRKVKKVEDLSENPSICHRRSSKRIVVKVHRKKNGFHDSGWPCVSFTGMSILQFLAAECVADGTFTSGEAFWALVVAVGIDKCLFFMGENVALKFHIVLLFYLPWLSVHLFLFCHVYH